MHGGGEVSPARTFQKRGEALVWYMKYQTCVQFAKMNFASLNDALPLPLDPWPLQLDIR